MDASGFFEVHEVHVGKDCGGRELRVAPADVARYRAGTGAPEAADGVAPPLLYHSEVYRSLSWYLPNVFGNLHARQEWELFHPMQVGDLLRSRSTVVERYRKRDRLYIVNEVLFTAADGRWLQRSRTHQSFLAEDRHGEVVVDREREKRTDRRFEVGAGEGEEIPSSTRTITEAMCEAFSGPEKNYHTDREMARALGFPEIVVQGMMSICFLADILAARFGPGWHHGGKLDVRLVNVVWANDTLTARAKVREEAPEGSHRRLVLDVWCAKPDGTVTTVGTASALA
jgi:acyl dehydratase